MFERRTRRCFDLAALVPSLSDDLCESMVMRPISLFCLSCIFASTSIDAKEIDRLVFSIEAIGHSPAGVPKLDSSVERIALGQAQPFLHEIALVYGVGMTHLHTDIILHIGYRFASGNLPEGSVVHNEPASTYGLSAVPMSVGLRLTPFSFRVRPMLGLDLGGAVANVTYVRPDNAPQESGWSLIGEIRGRAGVHVDVWQWLSAQAFVEGRWTQDLVVEHGPNFDTSGIGFGLSIVGHTGGPEAESLFTPAARASARDESESKDGLLREYDPDIAKDSRLERAFELIRKADDLVKRKDYLGAEDS